MGCHLLEIRHKKVIHCRTSLLLQGAARIQYVDHSDSKGKTTYHDVACLQNHLGKMK